MWQRLERKISFFNCLFDYFVIFFIAIHISRFFSSYFFCYPHFFSIRIFPSASAIRRYLVRDLQTRGFSLVAIKVIKPLSVYGFIRAITVITAVDNGSILCYVENLPIIFNWYVIHDNLAKVYSSILQFSCIQQFDLPQQTSSKFCLKISLFLSS